MTGFDSKRQMAKAKLEQPEQQAEPCVGKDPLCPCQDGDACHYKDCGDTKARPVPLEQPEQEPVISAWSLREVYFDEDGEPVMHRSPPAAQRPWVGLEAEEILDLFDRNNVYGSKWIEFARTVEAKLKERNNG